MGLQQQPRRGDEKVNRHTRQQFTTKVAFLFHKLMNLHMSSCPFPNKETYALKQRAMNFS